MNSLAIFLRIGAPIVQLKTNWIFCTIYSNEPISQPNRAKNCSAGVGGHVVSIGLSVIYRRKYINMNSEYILIVIIYILSY